MSFLNLNSIVGSNSGNTLAGTGNSVVFGGGGNDTLTSSGNGIRVLVGGSSNDTYQISSGINIVVETAGSADRLEASNVDLNDAGTSISVIDRTHLFIDNGTTQIILYNWLTTSGQLETFLFASGELTVTELIDDFASLPGFAGDVTWDEVAADLSIPTEALASFDGPVAATGSGLEDSLEIIEQNALSLEISSTLNRTEGVNDDVFFAVGNFAVDIIDGGNGDDSLVGDDGFTTLRGNAGNDFLAAGGGRDLIQGGAGNDISFGGDEDDGLFAGADDDGNDTLFGEAGNDVLGGNVGNDLLVGGTSNAIDSLFASHDLTVDDTDVIFGGPGNDTLIGGSFDDANDNGTFDLGEQVTENVNGNALWAGVDNDLLIGVDGDDTLGGGTGSDTILAGGGNDVVFGGVGDNGALGFNDSIVGGAGNDTVFASGGNDRVEGGEGDDFLYSGTGVDTVLGGAGNDTIFGGPGDDSFTGGTGEDTFSFTVGDGNDTITDFSVQDDVLDLSTTEVDFTDIASVQAAASDIVQNGEAGLLITIGVDTTVFLEGVSSTELSNLDIIF